MGNSYFLVLPLIASGLSALAFPPLHWSILGLFALWPLFWLAEQPLSAKRLGLHFFAYGFLHMLLFHRWLLVMTIWVPLGWIIPAWLALSFYFGAFYAIAGYLIKRYQTRLPLLWLFPAAWTALEWLRALGPFGNPAGTLGYLFTEMPPLLQWASIGGVYGLSFLGVFLSLGMYTLVKTGAARQQIPLKSLVFWGIVFITALGGGFFLLKTPHTTDHPLKVSVIQANHTQTLKLNDTYWPFIRRSYLAQTQSALSHDAPALVIWPEVITPALNTKYHSFMYELTKMAKDHQCSIVFGTPTKRDGFYYNSAAMVTPTGLSGQIYDKLLLMPFGEYWPLKSLLTRLGFSWAAGAEFTPGPFLEEMISPVGVLGISICLESLYPWHSRNESRSELLIALVNNAWFLDSPAAAQHYQMSRLRAVENNRYLIQAANTGISGIISPKGLSLTQSALDTESTITHVVYTGLSKSIYARFGDWIIVVSIGLLLFAALFPRKKDS